MVFNAPLMAQLKFVINDELLRKFKKIVLAKHGKTELTPEGEEAIQLYIERNEKILISRNYSMKDDPLKDIIGAIRTPGTRDALKDLKHLEAEE